LTFRVGASVSFWGMGGASLAGGGPLGEGASSANTGARSAGGNRARVSVVTKTRAERIPY
jgi:hypothetical protein